MKIEYVNHFVYQSVSNVLHTTLEKIVWFIIKISQLFFFLNILKLILSISVTVMLKRTIGGYEKFLDTIWGINFYVKIFFSKNQITFCPIAILLLILEFHNFYASMLSFLIRFIYCWNFMFYCVTLCLNSYFIYLIKIFGAVALSGKI